MLRCHDGALCRGLAGRGDPGGAEVGPVSAAHRQKPLPRDRDLLAAPARPDPGRYAGHGHLLQPRLVRLAHDGGQAREEQVRLPAHDPGEQRGSEPAGHVVAFGCRVEAAVVP